jgi:glutaredoxin
MAPNEQNKPHDPQMTTYIILAATFAGLYLVGTIANFFMLSSLLDDNNRLMQNVTRQGDELYQMRNDIEGLVLVHWQEIAAAKRTMQMETIAPQPANGSVEYAKDKILLITAPSCPMCQDQEDQLKELGIPYQKICFQITAQDGVECQKDNSYANQSQSREIILGYNIQAVPTIIINGEKTRTGMIYWNLTKEKEDLSRYLPEPCNDQIGTCTI